MVLNTSCSLLMIGMSCSMADGIWLAGWLEELEAMLLLLFILYIRGRVLYE